MSVLNLDYLTAEHGGAVERRISLGGREFPIAPSMSAETMLALGIAEAHEDAAAQLVALDRLFAGALGEHKPEVLALIPAHRLSDFARILMEHYHGAPAGESSASPASPQSTGARSRQTSSATTNSTSAKRSAAKVSRRVASPSS